MVTPRPRLSRDPNFRRFWLGQAASNVGDAFGFVAMPLLVLEVTHSVLQMGVVTAISSVGQVAAGTFSGVIVDRAHRRRLMVGADLGRLALYLFLAVCFWLGRSDLWQIYLVAAGASLLGGLFQVAHLTAVANIVSTEDIGAANGSLQATQALTYVIGSMIAGALCARFGAATAVAVNALSFGVSALSLTQVRFQRDRAQASQSTHGGGPFSDIAFGLRFLFAEPLLRTLLFFQMAVALLASIGLNAAVLDLIVFRLRSELSLSARAVGFSLGMAACGAVVGAIASARLRRRFGFGALVIAGTGMQAIGLLLCGFGFSWAFVTLGGMAWSSGLTLRSVAATSLRQTHTPDALLGRVTAAGWTLIFGLSAIGALLVTHLAAKLGATLALRDTGLALSVVSLLGAFSPLTRPRAAHGVPHV